MVKRSEKIKIQLRRLAKQGFFETEKLLYEKEAIRLEKDGFSVEKIVNSEQNHSERSSFMYRISWQDSEYGFANELRETALKVA